MATENNEQILVPIEDFIVSKQTIFFKSLKKIDFTGELLFVNKHQVKWFIYLYSGRIIYATGGKHAVRRWRRYLTAYMPQIASDRTFLQEQLNLLSVKNDSVCWEYELLYNWLTQERIEREQVNKMVSGILQEVFFDLNQNSRLTFHTNSEVNIPLSQHIFLIDPIQVIIPASKMWDDWSKAKLTHVSPDKTPEIISLERLQEKIPVNTYKTFKKLINGRNSFRDLSIQMKKDLTQLTLSLFPYIQRDYISLKSIDDLPSPITIGRNNAFNSTQGNLPLVVCVDDSVTICYLMGQIIQQAGFDYLPISDPLKAIPTILDRKPDLIFLDLEMPHTNGYEICKSLRKLTIFAQTPIIIVTGNDGMIERIKTKMVGCSDFVGKPIATRKVLEIIEKYLPKLSN